MNRRIGLAVAVLATTACDHKQATQQAAAHDPAAELKAAGDDVNKLCLLVQHAPGSAQAKTAQAKVKAVHDAAAPKIKATLAARDLPEALRKGIEGVVDRGADEPCLRFVVVNVADEDLPDFGSDDYYASSRSRYTNLVKYAKWPDHKQLGEPVAAAISDLGAGWLAGLYSLQASPTSATLTLQTKVYPSGTIAIGDKYQVPGLTAHVEVTFRPAPVQGKPQPPARLELTEAKFHAGGSIRYTEKVGTVMPDGTAASAAVEAMVKQLSRQLLAAPYELGLAPASPALAPFAGRWTVTEDHAVDHGCEGIMKFTREAIRIDPVRRELISGKQPYEAHVEGGKIEATASFELGVCKGIKDQDHFELSANGPSLVGTLGGAYHVYQGDCTKTCTMVTGLTLSRM